MTGKSELHRDRRGNIHSTVADGKRKTQNRTNTWAMSTENTDLLPLKFLDELRAFGFTPEEEERLRKSLTFKTFKKGYILDSRAGILSTRHYIVKGTARIYYIENGKERNYGFSFDNQFIVIPYSIMMRDRDIFIQFLEYTKV